ncbi:MAG: hypothetical protein AAF702_20955 [Chloroflexota bacterium]
MKQDAGPSYRRKEPFVLNDHHKRVIAGAVAKIDPKQIAILRKLTVAQRVQQAASMIRAAEQVGVYRLRQRESKLSEQEAYYVIRSGTLLSREIKKRAI